MEDLPALASLLDLRGKTAEFLNFDPQRPAVKPIVVRFLRGPVGSLAGAPEPAMTFLKVNRLGEFVADD